MQKSQLREYLIFHPHLGETNSWYAGSKAAADPEWSGLKKIAHTATELHANRDFTGTPKS